jgi:hypothetical protein
MKAKLFQINADLILHILYGIPEDAIITGISVDVAQQNLITIRIESEEFPELKDSDTVCSMHPHPFFQSMQVLGKTVIAVRDGTALSEMLPNNWHE